MAKDTWYIVHTYSGYEQKIERVIRKIMETDETFSRACLDVKVPFETLVETRDGKKHEVKKKILPGYLLVELDLTEETWKGICTQIRRIQGVTGFLGNQNKMPVPLSPDELANILTKTGDIKDDKIFRPKQSFTEGENVKIIQGPFEGFSGAIEEINLDKARLRVNVEIFGRITPIDVDYLQVEKV
ncbi:MAG: transcription termination/antitermination protein NusG [Sphaerochaetaceae bacterium]|jgi:transcriptional antiterminator NusG|nr:transcription termination/antitermination protein NusG [Sphaerochaetaceae bacterium]